MKSNQVYTDLEPPKKHIPDKAKEYIKLLEAESYFGENNVTGDFQESVNIALAIKATLLAELEALQWASSVKPIEVEHRIKELKYLIK